MRFCFTDEQSELKAEIKEFIRTRVSDDLLKEIEESELGMKLGEKGQAFYNEIYARGWAAVAWPKEYGGQGRSKFEQYIVEEEFQRIGLRIGGGGTGAPAIIASGTEEQKHEYVPATIRGEIIFAQGFSEPGCGTDLAAFSAARCARAMNMSSMVKRSIRLQHMLRRTCSCCAARIRTQNVTQDCLCSWFP